MLVLKKGASKEEMDALKRQLEQRSKRKKSFDLKQFNGALNLKEDPLEIQKGLRDERQ